VVRSVGSDLRMDYTAVGQTTHLAARMEQMAMPGSILITAGTLRLAEGYVEVEPLGPVPIKGLPAPVEAYEVRGAGRVRTRLEASAARGLSRFVGRDAEMEQLRTAQEQAALGHGRVVAVVGEPGVGKSRLFYEFIRSHRTRGWLILESASVSYGKATAYLPVIDLLKTYFRIEPRDDARTITEKVGGKVLMLDRTLEDTIPAILALLDTLPEDSPFRALEPPDRRRRTLQAIKALLLRESRVQPLVLVFEDLHWIDGETQAILDSLPAVPILLLVNYRPEYQHAWGSRRITASSGSIPSAGRAPTNCSARCSALTLPSTRSSGSSSSERRATRSSSRNRCAGSSRSARSAASAAAIACLTPSPRSRFPPRSTPCWPHVSTA
jgi:AAA ATPase domain